MLVVGISSWEPRACGIATYFKEQSGAIGRLGHEYRIVCNVDGGGHRDQPGVYGLIELDNPHWYVPVYDAIANDLRPDVVHVQHEFGLYDARTEHGRGGASGLITLLGLLRMEGIPTVVTCHTLCGKMKPAEAAHYRAMIPLSTLTVAHARYQVERLQDNMGAIPRNVTHVEHGANLHSDDEIAALRAEGKRRFGLEGYGWWGSTGGGRPTRTSSPSFGPGARRSTRSCETQGPCWR